MAPDKRSAGSEKAVKRRQAAVYALIVPFFALYALSAWLAATGHTNYRHLPIFEALQSPITLIGVFVIATISFFAIYPFAGNTSSRLISFLICTLICTLLFAVILPIIIE
jgi:hypothetical protein